MIEHKGVLHDVEYAEEEVTPQEERDSILLYLYPDKSLEEIRDLPIFTGEIS